MDDCHRESNATCTDTEGGFTCACREGFTGNGSFCAGALVAKVKCVILCNNVLNHVDIDECSNETICDANAQCSNTYGSFFCLCNPGYTGNGFSCQGTEVELQELVAGLFMVTNPQILTSAEKEVRTTVTQSMDSAPTLLAVSTALVRVDILAMVSTVLVCCCYSSSRIFCGCP